jgi:hypothetical protein
MNIETLADAESVARLAQVAATHNVRVQLG